MPFSSHSSVSKDVGAVEYVPVVEVTDGLLKWNGECVSAGVVGEVAVDVLPLALGGVYGCSKREAPTGDTSLIIDIFSVWRIQSACTQRKAFEFDKREILFAKRVYGMKSKQVQNASPESKRKTNVVKQNDEQTASDLQSVGSMDVPGWLETNRSHPTRVTYLHPNTGDHSNDRQERRVSQPIACRKSVHSS